MNKVVDFLTLFLGIRTANTTEGYRLGRLRSLHKIQALFKWAVFLLVGIMGTLLLFGALTSSYVKERNTNQKLSKLGAVLVNYQQTEKRLPANLNDVVANSPVLRDLTLDSWGNPILYWHTPANQTFTLCSAGKDQRLNTADDLILVVKLKKAKE